MEWISGREPFLNLAAPKHFCQRGRILAVSDAVIGKRNCDSLCIESIRHDCSPAEGKDGRSRRQMQHCGDDQQTQSAGPERLAFVISLSRCASLHAVPFRGFAWMAP